MTDPYNMDLVFDVTDSSCLRSGVRLALDWGKARVGIAACDINATLAYPVETVPTAVALERIAQLIEQYQPIEIVVGLPLDLRGQRGLAAGYVLDRVAELAKLTEVPIMLSDERMSTVVASRSLSQAKRSTRKQRRVIDQAAAVEILRAALEAERQGVRGMIWADREKDE